MVVVVRWSFYGRSFWPGGTVHAPIQTTGKFYYSEVFVLKPEV